MNLKEYLDLHKIQVSECAFEVGVSISAISNYANFKRFPRPDIARKIIVWSNREITAECLFGLKND